jgi:hypothetical protein
MGINILEEPDTSIFALHPCRYGQLVHLEHLCPFNLQGVTSWRSTILTFAVVRNSNLTKYYVCWLLIQMHRSVHEPSPMFVIHILHLTESYLEEYADPNVT